MEKTQLGFNIYDGNGLYRGEVYAFIYKDASVIAKWKNAINRGSLKAQLNACKDCLADFVDELESKGADIAKEWIRECKKAEEARVEVRNYFGSERLASYNEKIRNKQAIADELRNEYDNIREDYKEATRLYDYTKSIIGSLNSHPNATIKPFIY